MRTKVADNARPAGRITLDVQGAASTLRMAKGRKADADYLVKIADNIPGGRTILRVREACAWPVQSFVAVQGMNS